VTASYDATIERLEALYHGPLVPARVAGLRRMYRLLSLLDNPHRTFRCVHIVGSTGKGSTTSMIASIFSAAGIEAGVFRSPHLRRYSERISVGDAEVSDALWIRAFESVWPHIERLSRNESPDYVLGRPSLFEVLFAMACVAWRDSGLHWAVVEAGLGGRLDPTNVLAPDVVVITNVSLEHTQVLGSTVEQIAREKAAVIKPGCAVVSAATDAEASRVIHARAALVGAPVTEVGRDISVKVNRIDLRASTSTITDSSRSVVAELPMGGEFQTLNAACAVGTARALQTRGIAIDDRSIAEGLRQVQLAGRFQVLDIDPLVIADGAHNPAGARVLQHSLAGLVAPHSVHLVFGALRDKDVRSMAGALAPSVAHAYITAPPGTNRAAATDAVAATFREAGVETTVVDSPDEALEIARRSAGPHGTVVITGSMYLVGWLSSLPIAGGIS
jgi:dihydrofolate synthase / folylpolyglutamate synthase